MKDNKSIKEIAEQVVTLEKLIQGKTDTKDNINKLNSLCESLSLEDMLAVDDYIFRKKLLTK
jgi:hypothetical protein